MQQIGTQNHFSLKQNVRERFGRVIDGILVKSRTKEIVMVLDGYCASLISNLFVMTQLIRLGITVIDKLEIKRKKYTEMPVLYLIEPRESSIKYVIDDFGEQNSYARIHILFPYKCPKDILNQLSLNSKIIKYIRSIRQFYHSNFFLGDNVVSFKQDYLQVAYSEFGSNRQKNVRSRISHKFIEIFRSLGRFFQVNLYFKKSESGVAERVAETIEEDFKGYIRELMMEKESVVDQTAENVEVLILDRSIDPVTPLLHDLYYESMLFDLMGFQLVHLLTKEEKAMLKEKNQKEKEERETQEKDKLKEKEKQKQKQKQKEKRQKEQGKSKKRKKEKVAIRKSSSEQEPNQQSLQPRGLNQVNDQAYEKYRYQHIANVLQQLPRDIVTLSHQVKNVTAENLLDIDMSLSKKYQSQMLLVRECQRLFEQKNLKEVGELQQALSTGIDINGDETSSVKLIQQVKQLLQSDNLTQTDQLRLALISYCCISFSEKDYKKLMKMIPQQYHKVFVRMVWLGIGLKLETKRSTKNIKENIRQIALEKLNKHNMNLSRYSNIVELILPIIGEGFLNNVKIDEDIFGSIIIQENPKKRVVESANKKQTRKREKIIVEEPKGRKVMIVLFVGGGSFAEIRAIKNLEINKKLDIIIAADTVMTAQDYIDGISNMKEPN